MRAYNKKRKPKHWTKLRYRKLMNGLFVAGANNCFPYVKEYFLYEWLEKDETEIAFTANMPVCKYQGEILIFSYEGE